MGWVILAGYLYLSMESTEISRLAGRSGKCRIEDRGYLTEGLCIYSGLEAKLLLDCTQLLDLSRDSSSTK